MKISVVIVTALAVLALCAAASGGASPVVTLKVSPLAFSPNADRVKDTLRASIGVDIPVTLLIEISSKAGKVVYTNAPGVSVNAGTASFHWNGKLGATPDSPVAPDGKYTVRVNATDPNLGDEHRLVGPNHSGYEAAAHALGKGRKSRRPSSPAGRSASGSGSTT